MKGFVLLSFTASETKRLHKTVLFYASKNRYLKSLSNPCMSQPIVLGIYGTSNSGKTTLIENLIAELVSKNHVVATIKKSEHPNLSMDSAGKDTFRHTSAGAVATVLHTKAESDIIFKTELSTAQLVESLCLHYNPDFIFVEGETDPLVKKIRIGDCEVRENTIFDYSGDPLQVLEYLYGKLEKPCHDATKQKPHLSLVVNGKKVGLSEFPSEVIESTLKGLLQPLKGVDEIRSLELRLNSD